MVLIPQKSQRATPHYMPAASPRPPKEKLPCPVTLQGWWPSCLNQLGVSAKCHAGGCWRRLPAQFVSLWITTCSSNPTTACSSVRPPQMMPAASLPSSLHAPQTLVHPPPVGSLVPGSATASSLHMS